MREMKYQAWYNGKMYAINMIIWYSETNIVYGLTDPNVPGSQIHVGMNEAQRREYVGLKDCKGKEIYEGDIVDIVRILTTIPAQPFDKRGIITYTAPEFHASGHSLQGYEYEVIGNIYENGDLL